MVPRVGISVNGGYRKHKGRTTAAGGLRQRLQLLLGILAVALSLRAMHQLSADHTAADPHVSAHAAGTVSQLRHDQMGTASSDHAHLVTSSWAGHPSQATDCPGCPDHRAMALTCLAALVMMALSWVLAQPSERRVARLRRSLLQPRLPAVRWHPLPLSLVELSVSRT
jgi:hypothetical protein